ncbi:hypothetical protein H5410_040581 [Solanum commersonii]|uniref:Uncharacterized protein n=1 Tax=Solanum commersonii TaxID=4109 RepID=A0A9J5XP85_SOLCO|nr:hypothetical protein H5410_040581 [Solanum commersonii]
MTNQEADLSIKRAFAAMGGMSEDEEAENQSLLAIEQSDKYDFLALVAITEPGELENSCQTLDTILALMAGSDSEEEEEDKQDQVSLTHIKKHFESYSKGKLESLFHTLINAYESKSSEKDLLMEDYASLREDNVNLEQQNCLLQKELVELNIELNSIIVKNEDLQNKLHVTKMEAEHNMRWTRSSILLDSIQKGQSTTKHGIGFYEAKNPNIECLCSHCGLTVLRPPRTRSASNARLQVLTESSKKRHRTGKSPVRTPKTPIVLDTDDEGVESVHYSTPPPSQTLTKNEIKFLSMGKEAYFRSKTVLRGRTIYSKIREFPAVKKLLALFAAQEWVDMFLKTDAMVYDNEVIEFYTNLIVLDNIVVTSSIHCVELTKEENCVLTSKFTQGRVNVHPRKVLKGEMSSFHKLVFEMVHKGILPRGERHHEASFRDMGIGHALENMDPIDWPSLMIQHMAREFGVPFQEGRLLNINDMITRSTLADCNLLDDADQFHTVPPRVAGPVATLLHELNVAKAQNEELKSEVLTLQTKLAASQGEVSKLKDQIIKQQLDNNTRMDQMLRVLALPSPHPNPSTLAY